MPDDWVKIFSPLYNLKHKVIETVSYFFLFLKYLPNSLTGFTQTLMCLTWL